jgi:hypothetical protein
MLMVIAILETLKTIYLMEEGVILALNKLLIKDNGEKDKKMVKV